ncbi:LysR family transcriptional regulator [Micromonospora echinospora]|uniref:LysR family transcriptional regulator n=1 Tax=Micromonospora echinospora TaxID=1877 RepID=UPI0036725285
MNFVRLTVFKEVVRQGSLTRAAKHLTYTTSAVSQHISALERELGAVLLERLPRGVRLTEPGRALLDHVERILDEYHAAKGTLEAIAAASGGRLRLGSFPTADATLVARAVARFRRSFPAVDLTLHRVDLAEAAHRLVTGELDISLVYVFDGQDHRQLTGLELGHLLDDPLHVILPVGHRLAGAGPISLVDLAEENWIQGTRQNPVDEVLPEVCAQAGFRPRVVLRTDDQMSVQGLVAAGVGVGLVSSLAVPVLRADLVARPVAEPGLTGRIHTAQPLGLTRLRSANIMRELLVESARSMVRPDVAPRVPLPAHHS